jgi:hypothetical protein
MSRSPRRRKKRANEFRSPEEVARVYGPDWREKGARLLQDWIAEAKARAGLPPDFDPDDFLSSLRDE